MEKLTTTDMQELRWWFAEPPPESVTGRIIAQSYDPKGSGVYDPSTDYTLETIIERAKDRGASEWRRIRGILDAVVVVGGRELVDDLRRAFGARTALDAVIEYPEVAIGTPTMLDRASSVARDMERERLLKVAQTSAARSRCSPMTIAIRVLETDAHLTTYGFVVDDQTLRNAAERVLRSAEAEFLAAVKAETTAIVDRAGAAYREARRAIGASKHAAKVEREQANERYHEELRNERAAKSARRFEDRLRRAS